MKTHKWLKIAAFFQLLNALIHLSSFFVAPSPVNDSERQLFTLMDTYRFDMGTGFHRSMSELVLVFSACMCLLCLLAGWLNLYLLKKHIDSEVLRGVTVINLTVFGILSLLTFLFTFILPMVSIGLVVLFLALSILANDTKRLPENSQAGRG